MNNKMKRKILLYAGIVAAMLVLAYGFVPQLLGGKIVNQSDITGYRGMAHETSEWNASHPDDKTAWTDSMFGGMPNVSFTPPKEGDWTRWMYKALLFAQRPASYLFISLLGAFLLMLALGVHWLVALGGAIAITFCSYNVQIIQVGHNTKMQAIAFLPWALAAMIFTFKSSQREGSGEKGFKELLGWLPRTLLGAVLFGFALNFQIKANHVQITYYLAIMIVCLALAELVSAAVCKGKRLGRFFYAAALLIVFGLIGIGTNANNLIPTYSYAKETMRGGSELASGEEGTATKGLDLDYATAWSYGWEELPNMMIPNFNGGSSVGELSMNSHTVQLLRKAGQKNLHQVAKALPLYWGPQPFTAGPMYMGAITVFLFILGLCLCKGKEKWWMLAATVLAVFLAVGNHFMPFTKFWFNHIPFYNKFRSVSMALVILQFTLPMLGFLVLDRILKGEYDRKTLKRGNAVALVVCGGFCLLCALIPDIAGSFSAAGDGSYGEALSETLQLDRRGLLVKDAWISLLLIVVTWAAIAWGTAPKGQASRKVFAAGAVCLLVLTNMFSVGKRYLNDSHFTTQKQFDGHFTERAVDQLILSDQSPSYRVLDLSSNSFNDSFTSYFHKSIGGYSPAKLQRYQDLIERHLTPEINSLIRSINKSQSYEEIEANMPEMPAINMLNGKYIIIGADAAPIVNEGVLGACWFVSSSLPAATPEEEITLIGYADLSQQAVIGEDFAQWRMEETFIEEMPGNDMIELTRYAPNELRYLYSAESERTAVFSEIYYPRGWKAFLEDGTEIPIFRADWTLRAARLPAGEHELTMRFDPESYTIGAGVSRSCSAVLILFLLLAVAGMVVPDKKGEKLT